MPALSEENAFHAELTGDPSHSHLNQHLDTNGDGTGTKDMATTADVYYIEPTENEIHVIEKLVVSIQDDATMNAIQFGGIAALTNGVLLDIKGGVGGASAHDFTGGAPFKTNGDFGRIGRCEILINDAAGSLFQCVIEFEKKIRLDGRSKEVLVCQTQDNLSTLESMYVTAIGFTLGL